ncbi:hypothetical protein ACIBAI_22365 [Streptomyces sp. NPDC051041]|uniref:hypothetical protein n=1 Tax=Streptomyces sp. NPDC051041 TaxID=3365640 RepID=UPI00379ACC8F
MKTETVPPEAGVAVRAVCGDGTDFQLISDRRGSAVWKAAGPRGTVAVKVGTGPEGAVITAREATVLHAMGRGRLLAHGRGETAAWMVTPWYDGPSTWEALLDVRAGRGDFESARRYVVGVCGAVAELHAAGWVHGDLQPGHAIHTAEGVALIDCSWAWHPAHLGPSHLFRGGMPHLLAPETAAAVEAGEWPVTTSRPAEVYTVAASLWWAITGAWPLAYDAIGLDPARLTAAVLRRVIGARRIPLCDVRVWPGAQGVLGEVLTAPADSRPTAAELAALLRNAA